jgi:hypothetical protein
MGDRDKRAQAIKQAKDHVKKWAFKDKPSRPDGPLWDQETDDLFFSRRRRGLVTWWIPTGSPIYYEFEGKGPLTLLSEPLTDSMLKWVSRFLRKAPANHLTRSTVPVGNDTTFVGALL